MNIARRLVILLVVVFAAFAYMRRAAVQTPASAGAEGQTAHASQTAAMPASGTQPAPQPGEAPAPGAKPKPSVAVAPLVEKALRERVNLYWRARSKSDLLTAYTYYEPGFRSQYSAQEFLLKFQRLVRFRPQFLGIDRVRFEEAGKSAVVLVKLRTHPDVIVNRELISVTEESWLVANGVWCKKAEALLPSF